MDNQEKIAFNFPDVIENNLKSRFEVKIDNEVAFIDYKKSRNKIYLIHTEVPDTLSGRGVGTKLVRNVLHNVKSSGLQIVPWCPFVRKYLKKHPIWQKLTEKKQLL
jgi:predicted GNAT family acetyltransferase